MTRLELLQKIKNRRKDIGITMNNLSFISEIGTKTLARFFAGADVKLRDAFDFFRNKQSDFSIDLYGNGKAAEMAAAEIFEM
jgi:hypothetical protein